jgi:hypothetical protein
VPISILVISLRGMTTITPVFLRPRHNPPRSSSQTSPMMTSVAFEAP